MNNGIGQLKNQVSNLTQLVENEALKADYNALHFSEINTYWNSWNTLNRGATAAVKAAADGADTTQAELMAAPAAGFWSQLSLAF